MTDANDTAKTPGMGEGDPEAAHDYNEATLEFIRKDKVADAAEAAKRARNEDPDELDEAEDKGKERMKEEDPKLYERPGDHLPPPF